MPADCGKNQMRKKTGLEISPNVEEQDALASVVGCICFPGWTLNSLGLKTGRRLFTPVFSGLSLGLAQSRCIARVGQTLKERKGM